MKMRDEEFRSALSINIFDEKSLDWLCRTFALTSVISAIAYVSCIIVFECYYRYMDMENVVIEDVLKPIAIYDSCTNIFFNIKKDNNTLHIISSNNNNIKQLYAEGNVETLIKNNSIVLQHNIINCIKLVIWQIP